MKDWRKPFSRGSRSYSAPVLTCAGVAKRKNELARNNGPYITGRIPTMRDSIYPFLHSRLSSFSSRMVRRPQTGTLRCSILSKNVPETSGDWWKLRLKRLCFRSTYCQVNGLMFELSRETSSHAALFDDDTCTQSPFVSTFLSNSLS
jgi:hypothetical protein